jgi:predicted O-methyltransferase YrrM
VIYLEIGIHLGSTFIPALHGNQALATCIDNWSLDGHTRADFQANLDRFLPEREVAVIESDAFQVDLSLINQPVDVYFYDGAHDRNSQYMAFSYFNSVLADRFVVLIDDVRWPEPREETQRAIKELKYKNLWARTLPAKSTQDPDAWWDGLYVALLEKP